MADEGAVPIHWSSEDSDVDFVDSGGTEPDERSIVADAPDSLYSAPMHIDKAC